MCVCRGMGSRGLGFGVCAVTVTRLSAALNGGRPQTTGPLHGKCTHTVLIGASMGLLWSAVG